MSVSAPRGRGGPRVAARGGSGPARPRPRPGVKASFNPKDHTYRPSSLRNEVKADTNGELLVQLQQPSTGSSSLASKNQPWREAAQASPDYKDRMFELWQSVRIVLPLAAD